MARKASSRKAAESLRAAAREARQTRAAEPSIYTVFISHSSKERWISKQIAKEIKTVGVETWLDDTDLRGGDDIVSIITSGIQSSQEVLVVISASSAMRNG